MKKTISLLLALCLLCVCALTGCNNSTDPSVLAKKATNTIAMTINSHKINAVELNYYYIEAINSFCNEYSYYIYYMLDVYSPLNQQTCDDESGQTWADYFLEVATANIKGTYLLYDAAIDAGMTLTEEDEAYVQSMAQSLRDYAAYYEFDDVDSYLTELFGYGASLESYCEYYRINLLANNYYAFHYESLEFDESQLREYESKDPLLYNSYSYASYTLSVSKYLKGGSEDSSGNTVYTDAQQAAAVILAEAAAQELAAGEYADVDAFNAAIAALDVNASLASVSATVKTDVLYSEVSTTFQEWISDSSRVFGDTTVIAKTVTDTDGNVTVDGYYIVFFTGMNPNTFALKNVRHLLVTFADETDEANASAKAEAETLLAQWLAGEATEASFAALANAESDDNNSNVTNGGLYENIYPGQTVTNFNDWCYDESRQAGDYGIVETEYGYHIMYFCGNSDMTYRDYMLLTILRSEAISTWYNDALESTEAKIKNLDYVELDLILAG